MPTPRPIMVPRSGATVGTSMTAATNVMPERPIASPSSAVPMGSPAATTEPNAKSRMTTDTSRPIESPAFVWLTFA